MQGRGAPAPIPLMMVGTFGVFMPDRGDHWTELLAWLFVFYAGWSLITVPYAAWGAELTSDYDERSRVATARETWSVFGLLAAVVVPVLVQAPSIGGTVDEREVAELVASVSVQGWLTIATLPILGALLLRSVPDGIVPPRASASASSPASSPLLANRPFLLLVAVGALSAFATGVNQTSVVHFYRYVAQVPGSSDTMILVFFVAAIVGAPLWGWLAKRGEKHHVLALALALNAGCQIVMLAIKPGDALAFGLVQAGAGLAYTGPLILGASMAADVVDLDWLRSGTQRAGYVFAVMTVIQKASEAVAVGSSLAFLEWLGFSAADGNSAASRQALVTVNVIVPGALLALALVPVLAFPLTRRRQHLLERALRGRRLAADGPGEESDRRLTSATAALS